MCVANTPKEAKTKVFTFKRRLEDRSWFEGEEQLLSVLAESAALLGGNNELTDEACPVTDVVVLVILCQVEDILSQELSLQKKDSHVRTVNRKICCCI